MYFRIDSSRYQRLPDEISFRIHNGPATCQGKKKGPKRAREKSPQKISSLDMDVPCINEGPNSVPADLAAAKLTMLPLPRLGKVGQDVDVLL